MKRKPISLLAIFLSASFLFSGCELDTSTDSVSSSNAKSETSIATSIEESVSSNTPQEILESTVQTTSSATEAVTTTTSATTTTPASTTTEPDVEITEFSDEMKVHFIDQTTPNMIQRISEIFERKPLISKEIQPFLNFKWFRKGSFFMSGFKESKK